MSEVMGGLDQQEYGTVFIPFLYLATTAAESIVTLTPYLSSLKIEIV